MDIEIKVTSPTCTTLFSRRKIDDLVDLLTMYREATRALDFSYVVDIAAETKMGNVHWSKSEDDDFYPDLWTFEDE